MALVQGDELIKDRASILSSFLAAIQTAIPDVWLDEDGNLRILFEVESAQIEGLYVANQILFENLFIPSANYTALQLRGEEFGLPQKTGTFATGQLLFTGKGGTFIPAGSEVFYDPANGGDILYFISSVDTTIPAPGIPSSPVASDGGTSGSPAIPAGTYEYRVTYLTVSGETLASDPSNAVVLSVTSKINVTLPLGGPGTTGRRLYRALNGAQFFLVAEVDDNTTTNIVDNTASPGVSVPPTISTAESVLVDAQAQDTGSQYNAVAGSITTLSSVPDGITSVINPSVFANGSDEETMDDYRSRLLTFIRSPSTGGPNDLETWALEVEGVDSATIFKNDNMGTAAPGHVTIRISSVNGTVPPDSVVDAVYDNIYGKDLGSITIHVGTFTPQAIDVTVTITTSAGFSADDVSPNVELAIQNYINSIPVGGTFVISGVIQYVMEVVGVADVTVSVPATNEDADPTVKFVSGTIVVDS